MPRGQADEFTRFVGWQSQDDLPRQIAKCDVLVLPTRAQEALGRTAVEAMAAGKPVIANRLGGLPATVADGSTGLLCEPGDPADLAAKIATLLDDVGLRQRLGAAGRKRFEEHYAWDVIVRKHYLPLLGPVVRDGPSQGSFAPIIPARVNRANLVGEVAEFFGLPRPDVKERLRTYRELHEAKGYVTTLGEHKTLCFEEAFVAYVLLTTTRPRTLVTVGVGDGAALRRLLDMRAALGLACRVASFDGRDQLAYCTAEETKLTVGDLQYRFRSSVLDQHEPGLLFVDLHIYPLLSEIVTQTMAHPGNWVLALHDCAPGLCNPRPSILRNDPNVSSGTGVWERHVLAEAFGLGDPLSDDLDLAETGRHRLRIFTTPHGLGVIQKTAATTDQLGLADRHSPA